MIPAGTTVTCPSCDTEFETAFDLFEGSHLGCENCDAELEVHNSDLEEVDEDIYDDEEEDKVEENPQQPIGKFKK